MDAVLEGLKAGIRRFRSEVYPSHAQEYERAASEPQRPEALVVACADSRIDLETITQCGGGRLFVTRNIGNMVPAYGEMLGGVSAVVEYAVSMLQVRHIVVCGHTDCGAMKALLDPDVVERMPTVQAWLRNAHAALSVAEALLPREERSDAFLRILTEQNVLLQMQHMKTHPSIASSLARRELTISGWVYDIGSGEVRICEDGSALFKPVSFPKTPQQRTAPAE